MACYPGLRPTDTGYLIKGLASVFNWLWWPFPLQPYFCVTRIYMAAGRGLETVPCGYLEKERERGEREKELFQETKLHVLICGWFPRNTKLDIGIKEREELTTYKTCQYGSSSCQERKKEREKERKKERQGPNCYTKTFTLNTYHYLLLKLPVFSFWKEWKHRDSIFER